MAHFRSDSKRRFRSGSLAGMILLGGIGAALAAGPFEYPSFNRNQSAPTPAPAGVSKIVQPKRPIRLNHYSADWDKVIETLAEQSNLTLVMREIPPGKFSRRDNNDYSPEEAIRVLNHQLEKKGFRLLQQNDYLLVLNLDTVRTKYEPSTIPRSAPIQKAGHQTYVLPTEKNGYQRKFTDVRVPERAADFTREQQVPRKHYGGPGHVQPAAHQVVTPQRVISPPIQKVITPRISALEVARILHGNFGNSSELLNSGPGGYPAFQVKYDRQGDARDKVTFAIGIDTGENRLIIEAPEAAAREIEHAVGLLDSDVALGQKSFKMIPSTHNVSKLAGDLQPRMNRLLAMNAQETAQPNQNLNPPPATVPGASGPQGPVDTGAISSAMRSEVTVQAMPELGALVISGNEKDVEAVMAVIREIEKMSVGTAPSIELLILKHVDSTQLSTLLGSVYEDLTGRLSTAVPQAGQAATGPSNRAKVTFLPITKPNSLLILAPEADMESIKELAEALDQPVDPTTEFEVYSLRSAIATQVVTLLTNFFAEREGLGGSITAFADVRTNSIIVRARPRDLTEAGALIKKIDRDATGSVSKMKVIAMKFSVAQEVADVLNEAFQSLLLPPGQNNALAGAAGAGFAGTGESSQQLREIKSLAVEFLSVAGGKEELIRSGIVADIRITADPRINSLLVTAPEKSMNLIEALINHLDRLPSSIAEIKVFTLQNSDATQAAELLQNLLGTTATGGAGGGFQQQQQTASGIQVAGATDVTNALVPIRFSVDVRTNSVIAVGGADALRVVEAILLRLDEDDIRERKTTVIKLKNSPAEDVANAINDFLDSQRELNQSTPDLISNIELLEREIVVVPELITNSLLVSATPRYYDSIMEVIEKLDAAPPQVIIQALLVEVELGNTDEFGIELGLQDSILFGRSGIDAMTGNLSPGFLFNTPVLGNSPTAGNTQNVGGQGLSNFGVGRTNDDLGFGGLVLSASSESVSVLIRALAARRNVQILSRPQIRTLDNVQAQIQVGQQVPVVNGVNITNTGQANPNIEQQETGIILTVRPRITPEGTIIMETVAEKSQLSDDGVPIFVDTNGTVITSPIINISAASATVSVPNGHTIVMGGMITKTDTTLERKVPWLGDVPILGRAFRFDSTSSARTELLIFLTPRVIMNSADSEFIKQVESERMHFVEADAESVHGPLFAVPPTPGDGGHFIQLPDGTLMAPEAFDEVIDAPVIQQMGGTAPLAPRRSRAVSTNGQTQPLSKEQKADKSSWVKWPFKK